MMKKCGSTKAAQPDRYERFSGAIVSGPYNGCFLSDIAEEASVIGVHFKAGGAPVMLSLQHGGTNPVLLQKAFYGFYRWDSIRAAVGTLGDFAAIWS